MSKFQRVRIRKVLEKWQESDFRDATLQNKLASSKLRYTETTTDSVTGVKCRATCVAKNYIMKKIQYCQQKIFDKLPQKNFLPKKPVSFAEKNVSWKKCNVCKQTLPILLQTKLVIFPTTNLLKENRSLQQQNYLKQQRTLS